MDSVNTNADLGIEEINPNLYIAFGAPEGDLRIDFRQTN